MLLIVWSAPVWLCFVVGLCLSVCFYFRFVFVLQFHLLSVFFVMFSRPAFDVMLFFVFYLQVFPCFYFVSFHCVVLCCVAVVFRFCLLVFKGAAVICFCVHV